tara:strand:- start:343 stop:606 length:264 start_codon:yes stop_codon:yes gene_type:complete
MGCGCGKNKRTRKQSSRIPAKPNKTPCKSIEGVSVSPTMPSAKRKVALTKIKNLRNTKKKGTPELREEKRKESVQQFWQEYRGKKKR